MKGKPLIRIIVPVYNIEKYLDRCVIAERKSMSGLQL